MESNSNFRLNKRKVLKRTIENPSVYTVTFITTAIESDEHTTELEINLTPGGSNPLHRHLNFTETFIPLVGTLEIELEGNKRLRLTPGEQYTVPVGKPHRFINPGNESIRFRCRIHPGHQGFEYCLRILYGLAVDKKGGLKSWTDLLRASVILMIGDMRPCGKESVINPFINFLYKRACKRGLDRQLIREYCI